MHHDDIPTEPTADPSQPRVTWLPATLAVCLLIGIAWTMARTGVAVGFAPIVDLIVMLLWVAVVSLAAIGAGVAIGEWLGARPSDALEWIAVVSISGSGVLVGAAGALSLVGGFRPLPLLVVLLVCAVVGMLATRRRRLPRPAIPASLLPLVGVWSVALVVAGTTSPFYDQWHQHLGFPWMWLDQGSITTMATDLYTFMPVNSSLLFAFGLEPLGAWSAQAVHWWCGIMTVVAVASVARRVGSDGAAVWSTWLVATVPTVLVLATTAGSDLVVTMYAAGAWLGLVRSSEDHGRSSRWWGFSGVCVGLAVGTKYTALGTVALPVAVAAIVLHRPWSGHARAISSLRGAGVAGVAATMALGPWLVRNAVVAGNPLFPFLNRPFLDILRVDADQALEFEAWLSGFDLSWQHLVAGLDLGVFTPPMDGFPSVGPLVLAILGLTVVSIPWVRRPHGVALALGATAGIAFWLTGLHVCRYLLPALLPLFVVTACGLQLVVDRATPAVRRSAAVGLAVLIAWSLVTTPTRLGLDRLGAALGLHPEASVLERWVSSLPALEAVDQLPPEARLLLVAEARAYGFTRPVMFQDPYGEPLLVRLADRGSSAEDIATELSGSGITHVLANRWEMRRIAELHGRQRYFETDDPQVRERLDRFARACLEPTWAAPGLMLYTLRPGCDATPPGGEAMATW